MPETLPVFKGFRSWIVSFPTYRDPKEAQLLAPLVMAFQPPRAEHGSGLPDSSAYLAALKVLVEYADGEDIREAWSILLDLDEPEARGRSVIERLRNNPVFNEGKRVTSQNQATFVVPRAYELAGLAVAAWDAGRARVVADRQLRFERFRPEPPTFFSHRTTELAVLSQGRDAKKPISVLTGLGGVGKTLLAARYFHEHSQQFDLSAWIRCSDGDQGGVDLRTLAEEKLDIALRPSDDTPTIAGKIWEHVNEHNMRCLIVLDDVINAAAFEAIWPKVNGQVIVTSRFTDWTGIDDDPMGVRMFDRPSSLDLLQTVRGSFNDPEGATALVDLLGGLAIALVLAGAAKRPFYELAMEWRTRIVLPDPAEAGGPLGWKDISCIWEDSVAEATATSTPNLPNVFAFLCSLRWSAIDRDWAAASLVEEGLVSTADEFDVIIEALQSFQLVQLTVDDAESATYVRVPHALIAQGVWATWGESDHCDALIRIVLRTLATSDGPLDRIQSEAVQHLLARPWRVPEASDDVVDDGTGFGEDWLLSDDLEQIAIKIHDRGAYRDAQRLLEDVSADRENSRSFGPTHLQTLQSLHLLASAYWEAGRIEESTDLGTRVVAQRSELLGDDDPATLQSRNNLATSYWSARDWKRARQMFQEIYDVRRKRLGKHHPHTLSTRVNIANSNARLGEYPSALRELREIYGLCRKHLPTNDGVTLRTGHSLAMCHLMSGDAQSAEPIFRQVLSMREAVHKGTDHPNVALTRAGLSRAMWDLGDQRHAVECMEAAVRVLEIELPDHEDTIHAIQLLLSWRDASIKG